MTVFTDARAAQVFDGEGDQVLIDDAGLLSAEPARCTVNGGSERRVINWAGPWPLLEAWWEAPRHRARLQLLLTPATAILLVFEAGSWWLEAVYD
jgi:protein ImuB